MQNSRCNVCLFEFDIQAKSTIDPRIEAANDHIKEYERIIRDIQNECSHDSVWVRSIEEMQEFSGVMVVTGSIYRCLRCEKEKSKWEIMQDWKIYLDKHSGNYMLLIV